MVTQEHWAPMIHIRIRYTSGPYLRCSGIKRFFEPLYQRDFTPSHFHSWCMTYGLRSVLQGSQAQQMLTELSPQILIVEWGGTWDECRYLSAVSSCCRNLQQFVQAFHYKMASWLFLSEVHLISFSLTCVTHVAAGDVFPRLLEHKKALVSQRSRLWINNQESWLGRPFLTQQRNPLSKFSFTDTGIGHEIAVSFFL